MVHVLPASYRARSLQPKASGDGCDELDEGETLSCPNSIHELTHDIEIWFRYREEPFPVALFGKDHERLVEQYALYRKRGLFSC